MGGYSLTKAESAVSPGEVNDDWTSATAAEANPDFTLRPRSLAEKIEKWLIRD